MRTLGQQLRSVAARYQPRTAAEQRPFSRAPSPSKNISPASEPAASAEVSPLARDYALSRLEAVLFLSREPLSSRKLAQWAHLADGTEARAYVRRLNRLLDLQGAAFRVEEVAGGFQLMTRPMFAVWLRRLFHSPLELRLSSPAMETLAVVAYRQPVLRAQIEAIRGVQCDDILRQLMDRELIRIQGRSPELGRPLLYGTTKRFLQVFGLRSLDDLPRSELRFAEKNAETEPTVSAKRSQASEKVSAKR